jgi:hypothetical protein
MARAERTSDILRHSDARPALNLTSCGTLSGYLRGPKTATLSNRLLTLLLILIPFLSLAQYEAPKGYVASDTNSATIGRYHWKKETRYKDYTMQSYYIEMRDGIPIAVDVYLPKTKVKDAKFPTILHQTRYWRSIELKWPYNGSARTR